jgi:hypothetical protein
MPIEIKWVRDTLVEDFLAHEGYDWEYNDAIPLRAIDIAGAADNPSRVYLKFDQSNADGILLAVLNGIAIPPVVVADNKDILLEVLDGVHRTDVAQELSKRDGVETVAGYVVRNASPPRRSKLATRLNINQGRQLSHEARIATAMQWLKDGTCGSVGEAAANVGLKDREIADRWKLEQMTDRAIRLGVGEIFRERILDRDGKDYPVARAFDSIQNDVLYVGAARLAEKFELNIKEGVGLARTVADARSEAQGQAAIAAAEEEFTERDARAAQKTKGRPSRLSRGKKFFRHIKSADNVGPVTRWGLDGEDEREFDNMLAVMDRVERKFQEARKWILRLQEEARRVAAAARTSASVPGARPSGSASPPP